MLHSDEVVASARADLGSLWPLLRPGLWHSTPPERYRAILADGEIRPDGGQDGNAYKDSLAVSIKAVSLFDFENASEDDALGTYNKWSYHLWRHDTLLTVWIRLKRDLLPGHLILADEGGEHAMREGKNWYPRMEACHVGPIPVRAFAAALAVSTTTPCQFATLAIGEAAVPRLHELAEQWRKPECDLVQRLHAGRDRNTRRN